MHFTKKNPPVVLFDFEYKISFQVFQMIAGLSSMEALVSDKKNRWFEIFHSP